METNYKYFDEMEITISVKDLLLRVCLKWRRMIAWALIFAVLLNGFAIVKAYRSVQEYVSSMELGEKSEIDAKIDNATKKLKEKKTGLSQREIEEVERAVETYQSLTVRYNNALNYNQQSIKMQIDPSCVPTIILQYTVDNHYTVEYPVIEAKDNTDAILVSFCNSIVTDDVCKKIAKKMKKDIQTDYIMELITVSYNADNFIVKIVALSQDDCQLMSEVIKDKVVEVTGDLKKTFNDFDVKIVSEDYTQMPNVSILNDQTTQINNLNNMKNAFNNQLNAMTDKQKEYYYSFLDYESLQQTEKGLEQSQEQVNDIEEVEIPHVKLFHIKYILLGLFLGIFSVCGLEALCYLLTGVLRVERDMEDVFGIRVIGGVPLHDMKKKNPIDKMICRVFGARDKFTKEEHLKMICAAIRLYVKKTDAQNIYVTSTAYDDEIKGFCEELCTHLDKDIQKIEFGLPIIYDPESLEKMATADAVVLVEQIRGSRYLDIKKELGYCFNSQTDVVGCIVLN